MKTVPTLGTAAKAVGLGILAATLLAGAAFAQDAAAPAAAAAAPVPNKGDTAWMLVSSALVLMMSVPGLALFYGGLVRTKNMLSVLTQVMAIVSLVGVLWVVYGYSIALGDTTYDAAEATITRSVSPPHLRSSASRTSPWASSALRW